MDFSPNIIRFELITPKLSQGISDTQNLLANNSWVTTMLDAVIHHIKSQYQWQEVCQTSHLVKGFANDMDIHHILLLVSQQLKEADISQLQVVATRKMLPACQKPFAFAFLNTTSHFPLLAMMLKGQHLFLKWKVYFSIFS